MSNIDVSSIEIRDYAQSFGWVLVKEALADGLFVLNSPNQDGQQLVFPKDTTVSEFSEMAQISLKDLCGFYKKPFHQLIEEIREVNDDVISLRYFSQSKIVNSISFEEAYETIVASRQMLLSAASSVVYPALYHPKLIRTEPQDLIKKAKFRHTQEGSFILKIAIPFEQTVSANSLFVDLPDLPMEKSIGRKTVELISNSSKEIIEAVELNSIDELYRAQLASEKPIISYNFCDALTKIFDDERELPFELIFNWSRVSLRTVPKPKVPDRIVFPFAYKTKLDELKDYFAPKKQDISDTFIGTVEELNGDVNNEGNRSGEVILNLLIDRDVVKAKLNLNVERYQSAIEAHRRGGTYVKVKGKLHRSSRIATLDDITEFKISDEFSEPLF